MKCSNIYKYHATQEIVFVIKIQINLFFIPSHAVMIIQILNILHYSHTTKCIAASFCQNNYLFHITFQHLCFLLFSLLLNVKIKRHSHSVLYTESIKKLCMRNRGNQNTVTVLIAVVLMQTLKIKNSIGAVYFPLRYSSWRD